MDSRIVINITDEDRKESLTDDGRVLFALISRIAKAVEKHPEFADGMYRESVFLVRSTGNSVRRSIKARGRSVSWMRRLTSCAWHGDSAAWTGRRKGNDDER